MNKKAWFSIPAFVLSIFVTAVSCEVAQPEPPPYEALLGRWANTGNSESVSNYFQFNADETWSFTQVTGQTLIISGTFEATSNTFTLTGNKVTVNGTDATQQYPNYVHYYDYTWGWSVSGETLTTTLQNTMNTWNSAD